MKKIILILIALMVVPMVNAEFRGQNISLPTVYNSYITDGFFDTIIENHTFMRVGEDNPSFGFSTYWSSYVTADISNVNPGAPINALWSNIFVQSETGFLVASFRKSNGTNVVAGMNVTTVKAIFNGQPDFTSTSSWVVNQYTRVNLGSVAIDDLKNHSESGYWSVGIIEQVSPSAGNTDKAELNTSKSNNPYHFIVEYNCTPPSTGVWVVNVSCEVLNEQFTIDGLHVGEYGYLTLSNNTQMEITGSMRNDPGSKIKINEGNKIIWS